MCCCSEDPPGVEQNGLLRPMPETTFDLKAVESGILVEKSVKKRPKLGIYPLPVAEVGGIDFPAVSAGATLKALVKARIGRYDPQFGVKHDKRPSHGFHNALGIFPGILNILIQLLAFGDIPHDRDGMPLPLDPET